MNSSWISAGWMPSFPPGEQWDAGSAEVRFAVRLIDRSFACRVTLVALRARFEGWVKRKMKAGRYQPYAAF